MGPLRKRPRTKPPRSDEPTAPVFTRSASKPAEAAETGKGEAASATFPPTIPEEDASSALRSIMPDDSSSRQIKAKASWYGTWPRKSSASTQIARETILADKSRNDHSSSDLSRFESPSRKSSVISQARPPSMYLGKSRGTSDITMGGTLEADLAIDRTGKADLILDKKDKTDNTDKTDRTGTTVAVKDKTDTAVGKEVMGEPPGTNDSPANVIQKKDDELKDIASSNTEATPRPVTSSGWLGGWLGKPAVSVDGSTPSKPLDAPRLEAPNETTEVAQPKATVSTPASTAIGAEQPLKQVPPPPPAPSTSWFGLWATAAPSTMPEAPEQQLPVKLVENDPDTIMNDAPPINAIIEPPKAEPAAGSSWAFWSSTDTTKVPTKNQATVSQPKDQGELAVEGEHSETRPEPAQAVKVKDVKNAKSTKRGRPVSVEETEIAKKVMQPETASTKATPSQSPAPGRATPPNLLIPSVRSTYHLVENPTILQQITQLFVRGHQKPAKHVNLVKEPPKIRKALAVGIHGLFPAPLLRTVIGQPTGTSIRFANHAADAIRRWGDQHGCADCDIEKVALEGEGKIAERIDNLWKLLLNWMDHVRKADFILFACHSQGVPVAVMLIAKLIEFGVVSTAKIAVCAMAGVSLGPFADYKSRLFSGSAGELFEFADPKSVVSERYEHSLRIALKYGTRITFCGSIDDQLVSMESSIFSTASHPHIYRAVFVDGRIHAPNFLSHLVGFALKLRNLGVSDHGLIRELSAPLAGSLYTGEGHSRLYDDEKVYDLAIEYALETTSVGDVPLEMANYQIPTNANPYILPWIMRGLLEEDFVKTELDTEVSELLTQFDDWKPTTKVLKDVKYRLEAVRSKL